MILIYLQSAIRNLTKRKFVSLINLTGLSISLALFILIGLYIRFETSFDSFHSKSENTYLVTKTIDTPNNQDTYGLVNYLEGKLLADENPQISQAVRMYRSNNSLTKYQEKVFMEDDFFFTDHNLLDLFDFELLRGDAATLFDDPFNIVITEETALRYFGSTDALGEVVSVTEQFWNITNDFKVAGIVKDLPLNSHIQFDFLASFNAFDAITEYNAGTHQNPIWLWGWNAFMAYVELSPGQNPESLQANLDAHVQKHYKERDKEVYALSLTPLEEVYMRTDMRNGFGIAGNPENIKVLSGVALFILIIACINFVNLTTARSSLYAKEIGVKKVLGARRSDLFLQLITESTVLTLAAVLVSVVLVELALPVFENLVGKPIAIEVFSLEVLSKLLITGLLVGTLAGLYPAAVMSGFKPLVALRGERVQTEGRFSVRKVLVVFQFTASIGLVLGSMVIYQQLTFIADKDLGFGKEELLYMEFPSGITTIGQDSVRYRLFQDRIRNLSRVTDVTSSESRPGVFVNNEFVLANGAGEEDKQLLPTVWVDEHFFSTFGLDLTEGEIGTFDRNAPTRYFVNESAQALFGWDEAIGKSLAISGSQAVRRRGFVAGTLPDFNFESLYNPIKPMLVGLRPFHLASGRWNLFVRANTTEYNELIAEIQALWKETYPDRPFNITFLDQAIQQQYQAQANMLKILPFMTGFAVFIACLGLFGLASFVVERRTKEVGIRKVLGASVQQIVMLISNDFMKLLVIANLVAWPIAFFYLQNWLGDFSYRIALSGLFFLGAGLLVMCIAFLTISAKVVKGARSNPIDSLRYE